MQESANDIIHNIEPPTIPRITAIANMAWCERVAYSISFLGVQSNYLPGTGNIGSAVHRIVIMSILEIVQSTRNGMDISKSEVMDVFLKNAREEVDVNWKFYMLSGIENSLPMILEDLNVRADRLANQLTTNSYKKLIGPEFTIRNPLEGRLDLLKIRLGDPVPDSSKYVTSGNLVNLNIEDMEIVQIKTGKAKPRTPRMYMQADAEALLLMETLKLKKPPRYTWQFSGKDVKHVRFKFDKVHQAIAKFIRLWKAQVSPTIKCK